MHFCTNCKTHGHGARDRLCPAYLKQCTELNTRMPENLYKFFPTANPCTWELTDPPENNDHHHQPDIEAYNEWTRVTNKRRKQYSFPPDHDQPNNRNRNATNTNSIPLGQRKEKTQTQTFLDDAGFANPARPGPSQQYRIPSQRQRADDHCSSQSHPSRRRSLFSPLHTRSSVGPSPTPPRVQCLIQTLTPPHTCE